MKAKPARKRGTVVLEVDRRDEPLLAGSDLPAASSPFRIQQIVVPVDFSDCSRKALRYALPLAKEHRASVTLLYIVPPPSYAAIEMGGIDTAALESDMRANAEMQLAALINEEVRGQAPAHAAVLIGPPAVEINRYCKALPADLIVISTHGRTGLKHVFLGSVAEHVIRHAPCPVLVVREEEHEFLA